MSRKTFPRGYKQFKVLEFLNSRGSMGARYTEITKMAYELSHGEGTFDPIMNRGYWSGAFAETSGYFGGFQSTGWMLKYARKNSFKPSVWVITEIGRLKLAELRKKFVLDDNGRLKLTELRKKFVVDPAPVAKAQRLTELAEQLVAIAAELKTM